MTNETPSERIGDKTPQERMTDLLNFFLEKFNMLPSKDVKLLGIRCNPDNEWMEITTNKCKMHIPPDDLEGEVADLCELHFLEGA